ncbi:NAD(P)-dependent oxidoreductase [Streptacidiphilus sp. PB12-B1b]|nr:NAD(P)-dependent oxidoreductase [Streptacidiphilus sp. PB12-B1b]
MVVTGAGGFIGSAVLRALADAADAADHGVEGNGGVGVEVRAVARGARANAPGVSWVQADLTDPGSLHGLAQGADVLVHLAARVSGDEASCRAVNLDGTRALVREAERAKVPRLVLLSTAAVYGPGPHRGVGIGEVVPAPVSAASRTRLAAEQVVREAGGLVLRPGLVLGRGDRWVVPALAELLRRVPGRWDGGSALLSLVAVEDLARLVTALALDPDAPRSGVYHASHPQPVRIQDLLDRLTALGVLPHAPQHNWSWPQCLDQLRSNEGNMSERQFALLAQDHWYRSEAVWTAAACPPGPGPLARLADAASWYREALGAAAPPPVPGAEVPGAEVPNSSWDRP